MQTWLPHERRRNGRKHPLRLWLIVATCWACTSSGPREQPAERARAAVIYGRNDLIEAQAWAGTPFAEAAIGRAVALIPAVEDEGEDGGASVGSAQQRFDLCPEEPFASQPSTAACSGVLIDDDVLLTAGHCFDEGDGCERYRYALGFVHAEGDAAAPEPVSLGCTELIAREVGQLADGSAIDYALVRLRLDEPPHAQPDIAIRSRPLEPGEHLTSVGFPQGLPLKVDPAARAVSAGRTELRLTTDAYAGNSGSAIYDADGALAAILTGGQPDFEWDEERDCQRSRVIDGGDTEHSERALYAWLALARACVMDPGLALCGDADAGADAAVASPLTDGSLAEPELDRASDASTGGSKSADRASDGGLAAYTEDASAEDAGASPPTSSSAGCTVAAHTRSGRTSLILFAVALGAWLTRKRWRALRAIQKANAVAAPVRRDERSGLAQLPAQHRDLTRKARAAVVVSYAKHLPLQLLARDEPACVLHEVAEQP